jgi:hypothetical protein
MGQIVAAFSGLGARHSAAAYAIGPIPSAGTIGSMLIRPDGSRVLDRLVPDPASKADKD